MASEILIVVLIALLIRRIFYKKAKRTPVDYIMVIGVAVILYCLYIIFVKKTVH